MKLVEGFREGSTKSGGNLLRIADEFLSGKTQREYMMKVRERSTPGNMAVCWGVVTNAVKIPLKNSLMMLLYTFSVGILGAATRLGIVDHVTVQKTLHSLRPAIVNTVKESLKKRVEDMTAFVPTIDVMGMRHKRLSIRMFIN
jgi:urease accessory protein